MATAPTPAGPWTDSGAPVVGPRGAAATAASCGPSTRRCVTDRDGSQWIFYGSYNGGVFVAPLDDGRHGRSPAPRRWSRSTTSSRARTSCATAATGTCSPRPANCCAGPTTGYSRPGRPVPRPARSVRRRAGRRRCSRPAPAARRCSPRTATAGSAPGTTRSPATSTGQDWIVYHAIDRGDPFLDEPFGINQRPMLIDRLDWVGGWPAVRGRAAARAPDRSPAPRTADRGVPRAPTGAGVADRPAPVAARCGSEADLAAAPRWSPAGHGAGARRSAPSYARRAARAARWSPRRRRRRSCAPARRYRPASTCRRCTRWSLAGRAVTGPRPSCSHARLGDPLAVLSLPAARRASRAAGRAGAAALGAPAPRPRNVTVTRPARSPVALVTDRVPIARSTRPPATSSTARARRGLDLGAPGPGRHGQRRRPALADPGAPTSSAPATPPASCCATHRTGAWAVETKLTIDLGVDTVRNYQQAGLVVYAGDDLFTRLSPRRDLEHPADRVRQGDAVRRPGSAYGGTIVGPPADTT